jgi:hypothetical protein
MRRETCTPESQGAETNVDDDLLKVAKRKVRSPFWHHEVACF